MCISVLVSIYMCWQVSRIECGLNQESSVCSGFDVCLASLFMTVKVEVIQTCMHVYVYTCARICIYMRSLRTQSVMGSNPTQGSFFFEKRESCTGCISLPCLIVMYVCMYVHVCGSLISHCPWSTTIPSSS